MKLFPWITVLSVLAVLATAPAFAASSDDPEGFDDDRFEREDDFTRGNENRGEDDRGRKKDDDRGGGENDISQPEPVFTPPVFNEPVFTAPEPPPVPEPPASQPGPELPAPSGGFDPVIPQAPVTSLASPVPTPQYEQPAQTAGSVYAQSSSSFWASGDPFAGNVPALSSDQATPSVVSQGYTPASSFVYVVTGKIVERTSTSLTIRDSRRDDKTVFADPALIGSLKKGNFVQVSVVPGSNKAQDVRQISR